MTNGDQATLAEWRVCNESGKCFVSLTLNDQQGGKVTVPVFLSRTRESLKTLFFFTISNMHCLVLLGQVTTSKKGSCDFHGTGVRVKCIYKTDCCFGREGVGLGRKKVYVGKKIMHVSGKL